MALGETCAFKTSVIAEPNVLTFPKSSASTAVLWECHSPGPRTNTKPVWEAGRKITFWPGDYRSSLIEPDWEHFLLICHPDECAQQLNSRPLGSLGHNISQISRVDLGREVWLNGKGNIKKSFEKVLKRHQLP